MIRIQKEKERMLLMITRIFQHLFPEVMKSQGLDYVEIVGWVPSFRSKSWQQEFYVRNSGSLNLQVANECDDLLLSKFRKGRGLKICSDFEQLAAKILQNMSN